MRSPQAPARPRGPGRRKRYDPEALIAAGKWSPEQQAKIEKVMGEFKAGTLDNGHGGKVTSRKQALAIALSKAREITAAGWDESKHPRHEKGSKHGGRFRHIAGQVYEEEIADSDDDPLLDAAKQMRRTALTKDEAAETEVLQKVEEHWAQIADEYPNDLEHAGELEGLREELGYTGAEEDDGEVDPYATDYDEAGGDEVQPRQERLNDIADATEDPEDRALAEAARGASQEEFDAIEQVLTEGWDDALQEERDLARAALERWRGRTASGVLTASAAGLAPMKPPKTWFEKPSLKGPTPITVTADGQVYGHAALWGTCHTGMPGVCRTPPRSQSDYAYFHLGEVDTDDGPVHVGRVSMDTGHAPLTASRDGAVRHYDDTGTQIAHVRAYEDDHGIVLAGALVPDAPAEKARRFKGATVSGDWRSIGGKLELVGMLAVNVPGFPVPRSMAASLLVEDEPHTMSLVAAGIYSDPEDEGRKLKALTARALGGLEGLAAAAGYEDKSKRRMGVTAAAWDESKHPRGGKGTHEGGKFVSKKQGTTPTEGDKKPGDMTPDEYAAHMEKIQEDYAAGRRGAIKSEPDSIGLARDLGGQEVAPGMEIVDQSYDVTPPGGKVARRYGYFSLRDKATGAEMTALPSNATVTKTELGHIRAAFDAAEAVDLSKPKTELASILNKTSMKQNGVFRVRLIDRLAAANRNPFRKGSMDWEMVQHYVDNPNPRSGFDKT